MKNINEINPLDYGFFHLAKLNGDVKAFVKTTNGRIEASDIDYYQTDNGVLICFKEKFNTSGNHDYQIVGDNGEYRLQMVPYEDMQDVFDRKTDHVFSYYSFCKSVEIPSSTNAVETLSEDSLSRDGANFIRCDYNKFGPVSFYPKIFTSDVAGIKLVLSASGIGHILRVDANHADFLDKVTQMVNTYSRTLSGTLKQIFEWSEVSKPPFNNTEEISITAKNFIDALGLDTVLNDIDLLENNMRVKRYLLGNNTIYEEIEENDVFPESLKSYFLSHMRYKTINSLLKNSNNSFTIDNSILNKEKSYLEKEIYTFCMANGIDTNLALDNIELLIKNSKTLIPLIDNILDKINRYKFL